MLLLPHRPPTLLRVFQNATQLMHTSASVRSYSSNAAQHHQDQFLDGPNSKSQPPKERKRLLPEPLTEADYPGPNTHPHPRLHPRYYSRLKPLMQRPLDDSDLEQSWHFFTMSSRKLRPQKYLAYMERFIVAAEKLYSTEANTSIWGRRISTMLGQLRGRMNNGKSSRVEYRFRLMARAMALMGNIERATAFAYMARRIPSKYIRDPRIWNTIFENIMLSIVKHRDKRAVIDFIVSEWSFLGPLLTQRSQEGPSFPDMLSSGRVIRRIAFKVALEIPNPVSLVKDSRKWNKEQRQSLGNFLIEVLCFFQIPFDALDVYYEMQRQNLQAPTGLLLALVRSLTSASAFGPAESLYHSIPKHHSPKYHLSTGLHLYSHRGNFEEAENYFQQLKANGWVFPNDITMLISVYTRQLSAEHRKHGRVVFNRHFPKGPDQKHLNSPRLSDYNAVMQSYKLEGDIGGASAWLEDMSRMGLNPNIHIYTTLLETLAFADNLAGIQTILDHMRSAGIRPNAAAYTVIISLLAHRKEAASAEAVFQQALQEGIIPDRKMVTSMMNAQAEAGSWDGVIRLFNYLDSFPFRHRLRLTIEVYNTLLKAYVLSGSPFFVVSGMVRKLEDSGILPDNFTFALLIQSACDAGRMDIASDLFWELDELSETEKDRGLKVTVYVLTILMTGFLRKGDMYKAKQVYDLMIARRIQPTATCLGAIIKAYGTKGTKSSLDVAENFIQSLVARNREEQVWNTPAHGRKSPLEHLYEPLLRAYSRQAKTEEVERAFRQMVEAGGSPSLGTLTTVLDAYRRKFDLSAVCEIWSQILELGLAQMDSLPQDMKVNASRAVSRGFALSVPFSMFIDVVSASGLHSVVKTTWQELAQHGFSFDSHNWNHLSVAFVRAAEVEKAFEIVENLLVRPSSDFSPDSLSSMFTQLNLDPVPRLSDRRSYEIRNANWETSVFDVSSENRYKNDFVHPLQILHQISPSWRKWRPHKAVLTVLLRVLAKLESGNLVSPIRPDGEQDYPIQNEADQAHQMLTRIYNNYPKTVDAVHKAMEREKMQADHGMAYGSV